LFDAGSLDSVRQSLRRISAHFGELRLLQAALSVTGTKFFHYIVLFSELIQLLYSSFGFHSL
jgi:hypothetical protein